jgi:hypothetical protein
VGLYALCGPVCDPNLSALRVRFAYGSCCGRMYVNEARRSQKGDQGRSVVSVDPSMGYLAVTCKPELPVRDRVAWYFHWKHPSLIAAREYWVKSERDPKHRKRVDLAILDDASLDPVVLVEFKAMIVPDPLSDPEHPLMVSLADDLKKLGDLCRTPRFGVMLMVHIEDVERLTQRRLHYGVVKYMDKFCTLTNPCADLQRAKESTSDFFGGARPFTIELGSVWGAGAKLICFILESR